MRLKILIISTAMFCLLPFVFAQAQDYGLEQTAKSAELKGKIDGVETIPDLAGKLVGIALSLIGIFFFGLMLYAGFMWMGAMGNSESVDKAKGIMEAAIIGLVIISASYAITRFVFSSLQGNIETPTPSPASITTSANCKAKGGICGASEQDCAVASLKKIGACSDDKTSKICCGS